MGIVNVTPDSFSDGGQWTEVDAAIRRGVEMLDAGVAILDIGGESTRPGAEPVTAAEELGRIMPVIRGLLRLRPGAVLSVDTYHAETADRALAAGVAIVNDVSGGLWDRDMLRACAAQQCGIILMHTRGTPREWRSLPPLAPADVVPLVCRELGDRLAAARAAGIDENRIVLDPGFGFGKAFDENYPLLACLNDLLELGRPLAVGLSRKGFLRRTLEEAGPVSPEAIREATVAANTAAILAGAHIIRVHDAAAAVRAARIADRILRMPLGEK